LRLCERATQLRPERPDYWQELTYAYEGAGQPQEAEAARKRINWSLENQRRYGRRGGLSGG
jgi:predicted Zn-dependent protease